MVQPYFVTKEYLIPYKLLLFFVWCHHLIFYLFNLMRNCKTYTKHIIHITYAQYTLLKLHTQHMYRIYVYICLCVSVGDKVLSGAFNKGQLYL